MTAAATAQSTAAPRRGRAAVRVREAREQTGRAVGGATAPGGGAPGAACADGRTDGRGSPRPARLLTSPWTRRSGAPASGRRPGRDGGVCGRRGLRAAGPGGGWRGRAYLAECRGHLVGEGPGHDHDVRLARAGPEDHAEAVHVVAGRRHVHHLHGAAGQAEGHGPQGALGAGQSVVSEQWPAFKDKALSRRTSRS